MKLIDEKGRFLKTINIIDLMAILVVVALVLFVGMRLIQPDNNVQKLSLVYTVKVSNVEEDVWESMQEVTLPDQLMASGELLDAYVTSVEAIESEDTTYELVDANELQVVKEDTVDLIFTIEASVPDNVKNEVGTQEVRIGKRHIVKTEHFEFEKGIVTEATKQ